MTVAITSGPRTPTIPLRLATDNSSARLVKARTGMSMIAQLAATRARQRPGAITAPESPTR